MGTNPSNAFVELDARFDAEVNLIYTTAKTGGYHTNVAEGSRVHETRESTSYAALCLRSDDPGRISRGQAVLRQVLALQETDTLAATFGIWSWFYEEPLSRMTPADWNWADFIGARLLLILAESSEKLDVETLARLKDAIERAAMSIFRRQAPVSYTNIAIMGSGVCAAAGERLGRPLLLEYGRNKLRAVLKLAQEVGCFSEYNSPTYTMVAIEECERILAIVGDEEIRRAATDLHAAAWKMVAEHWHQPTRQWAGPHGRAYSDLLPETTLRRIERAIGRQLVPGAVSAEDVEEVSPLPCPKELVEHFVTPITTSRTLRQILDSDPDGVAKIATTWLAPTCCLSSVTREHTWNQRRDIIAYWQVGEQTAVFKAQWLLDGRDMAGMRMAATQVHNRVLMSLYPLYDCGAWHPLFFIPKDSTHAANDLRLRFVLRGPGVKVEQRSASVFDLVGGDHTMRIITSPGDFDSTVVRWQTTQENGTAMLDAVCVDTPQKVNFHSLRVRLAAGLQLLRGGEKGVGGQVTIEDVAGQRKVEWAESGMEALMLPAAARPFSW